MAAIRKLTVHDHDRDAAGLTYVYPVVSRRAAGVSIGINLNPNNACNWHCVYCQVPDLVRGAAPEIDEDRLAGELSEMLDDVQEGDWLERHVDEPEHRRIVDVAFSGNGEPTTCTRFDAIVARVLEILEQRGISRDLNKVLITNGSMMQRPVVQAGVQRLGDAGGETWFKLDSATPQGRLRINGVRSAAEQARRNLRECARRCRTRIQTCVVQMDGAPPSRAEQAAYLGFLAAQWEEGTPIADVLLYGMARPSLQPEAPRLAPLPEAWLHGFAYRIRELGIPVVVRA